MNTLSAEAGTSRTDRVYTIERFFQKIYYSDKIRLSIKDRSSDLAVTQASFKLMRVRWTQFLTGKKEDALIFMSMKILIM